mmetsp:Transcript_85633/g.261991  ORF Transcript_85633/g.261991 Transcript_85633/m.261991 type:complete len:213 (-) Transcript_85633:204-842(-)
MLLRGWWMVTTTVCPCWAKALSVCMTCIAWKLSKPDVGSSRKTMRGWWINSQPMLTRLRSPPEMPRCPGRSLPMTVSAAGKRPKREMAASTRWARSTACGKRSLATKDKVSRTVDNANKASSCSTYAVTEGTSRRVTGSMASPFAPTRMSPSSRLPLGAAGVRPANAFNNEVLPEPLGPRMANTSPGRARPLTPSSTTLALLAPCPAGAGTA